MCNTVPEEALVCKYKHSNAVQGSYSAVWQIMSPIISTLNFQETSNFQTLPEAQLMIIHWLQFWSSGEIHFLGQKCLTLNVLRFSQRARQRKPERATDFLSDSLLLSLVLSCSPSDSLWLYLTLSHSAWPYLTLSGTLWFCLTLSGSLSGFS